jgi:hypothetical protein
MNVANVQFSCFLGPGRQSTAPGIYFEGKTLPSNFFLYFYLNERC